MDMINAIVLPWIYSVNRIIMKVLISERIKELMQEQKLNQMRLAEKTGLNQSAISNWLSGKKEPSITSLWLLADCFNTDVDYLIGRKDF